MIDRGFIKWQPFNSVTSKKEIFEFIDKKKTDIKPVLFPEEIENLSNLILESYYAHNYITLTFYEQNRLKTINTFINKIDLNNKTIGLDNNKTLFFSQIVHLK